MKKTDRHRLRELFIDSVDLEQELFQEYEKNLDNKGIFFTLIIPKSIKFSFFEQNSVLDILLSFSNVIGFLDNNLRNRMDKPWFFSTDKLNLDIIVDDKVMSIETSTIFTEAFRDIYLFQDNKSNITYNGFLNSGRIIFKIRRTKREVPLIDATIKNSFLDNTGNYYGALKKDLADKVYSTLYQKNGILDEYSTMTLQERLAIFGYRYSHKLNREDLDDLYTSQIHLNSKFQNPLDAAAFVNNIFFGSNTDVMNSIRNNPYKDSLMEIINQIEQGFLILHYQGASIETEKPYFSITKKSTKHFF